MIRIFWYRRDLRMTDNKALFHALHGPDKVLPIFIFDCNILENLEDKNDLRVNFIVQQINLLNSELKGCKSGVEIFFGEPLEIFKSLLDQYQVSSVYANLGFEPYDIQRDKLVGDFLSHKGIPFNLYTDHTIFHPSEVLKSDGNPYTVFTAYKKKWLESLTPDHYQEINCKSVLANLEFFKNDRSISAEDFGFISSNYKYPDLKIDLDIIDNYELTRDYPGISGTSKLGIHLRFGTLSIRNCLKVALQHNETWLSQLIWREFFIMILYHFPNSAYNCFKPQFEQIQWINSEDNFQKWCMGMTGIPIIDAGMRQLISTGFMHNRVRMITASFLTKNLLIDWRWGEAWFASKLLDYEMASNVGNWQWAAGTGCDAAPYFRIFNPFLQAQKFDPDRKYINMWVPEWQDSKIYPNPIIDLKTSRERALKFYKDSISLYNEEHY